ncbi:FAD-dependent oxidoreductase [Nocardioides nitrophenolicus]|uniref:FAD-dependent oxidoreductase n=1 Tax=Nocardioides nitrophenolicus TaxID=60489 RepID=UPI00195676F9|nr:FAD-dependent oxidoreductase [Nocardioides nitrophenolicus]MBM7516507.1 3-oxosteroid 1-dehydrogenase [Nocardioides nitrophenolicus]
MTTGGSASAQDTAVLVVGAGLSGLATALGVALRGGSAEVFEAADLVGGAAAYSGGQVWVGANHVARREGIEDDTLELAERYVRAIAHDHPEVLDEDALRRWLAVSPEATKYWEDEGAIRWTVIPGLADYHNEADGALPAGRYLTNEVIDGGELGEWRDRLRVSPYFPVGTTYADMFVKGRRLTYVDDNETGDEQAGVQAFGLPERREDAGAEERSGDPLTFGTGVVASFLRRVLREERITIHTGHPVTELLADGSGDVLGLRATSPDGAVVERRGPVVLATSTYDWDAELVRELVGLGEDDFGSVAPDSIRGDGIRLARSVGGAVAVLPPTAIPMLPGWKSSIGSGYAYGPDYAMPHAMIVDRTGRRYCDDSYWVDIVAKTMAPDDPHLPFFLVFDEQHHQKYGLGVTPPGGDYPDGLVTSAATLRELGAALGIDGEQLEVSAAAFSEHARAGEDPDFGRGSVAYVRRFAGDPAQQPNPVLGPIEQAPFHGFRLRFVGTGIGSSGVHIDGDGHVLDESGTPIAGLYAVGSCAALTTVGTGYNSGIALGRGLALAYLVSRELCGDPVPTTTKENRA